jgi:Family of unknown function (DUF6166)
LGQDGEGARLWRITGEVGQGRADMADMKVDGDTRARHGAGTKTYSGRRTIDGLVVTVDGQKLDEHYEVKRFTRFGFEWSYDGDSPRQLALAILVDYLGDPEKAVRLSGPFMRKVVANFDNDWALSAGEIEAALRDLQAAIEPQGDRS